MKRYPGYRVGFPHPNVPSWREWYTIMLRRLFVWHCPRDFWNAFWWGRD